MKRKVLFLLPWFGIGGVEKSFLEALKVIDSDKYDITLFLRYNQADYIHMLPDNICVVINKEGHYQRRPKTLLLFFFTKFLSVFNAQKSEEYNAKLEKYIYKCKLQNPYKKFFRKADFDVVISYAIHTCTEMAAVIPARKHIVFFHSSDKSFHKDICDRCFNKFDNIIAVSNSVKEMLVNSYPEYSDKISVLKNFIDKNDVDKLSKQYMVDVNQYNKDFVLSSVIRLDKEKGADMLISAAESIKSRGVSFVWIVVGDGSCRSDIEQQIKDKNLENDVVLLGFKDNPYPYIRCCDIFVHTAYEESFGLSILEALLLEKAVVSTDTMGAREVLLDGKCGLLVPIDSDSISEGIMELLYNPSLKVKFENSYKSQNELDKNVYREKWNALLDGGAT